MIYQGRYYCDCCGSGVDAIVADFIRMRDCGCAVCSRCEDSYEIHNPRTRLEITLPVHMCVIAGEQPLWGT